MQFTAKRVAALGRPPGLRRGAGARGSAIEDADADASRAISKELQVRNEAERQKALRELDAEKH